jgi:hypothetical protein
MQPNPFMCPFVFKIQNQSPSCVHRFVFETSTSKISSNVYRCVSYLSVTEFLKDGAWNSEQFRCVSYLSVTEFLKDGAWNSEQFRCVSYLSVTEFLKDGAWNSKQFRCVSYLSVTEFLKDGAWNSEQFSFYSSFYYNKWHITLLEAEKGVRY